MLIFQSILESESLEYRVSDHVRLRNVLHASKKHFEMMLKKARENVHVLAAEDGQLTFEIVQTLKHFTHF